MAPKNYKLGRKTPELEPQIQLEIPAELTPGVTPDQIADQASEKAWDLHEQQVAVQLGQSALPHWTERPIDLRPNFPAQNEDFRK